MKTLAQIAFQVKMVTFPQLEAGEEGGGNALARLLIYLGEGGEKERVQTASRRRD